MSTERPEQAERILTNHADAAALMLAGVDDRDAMATTIRGLTHGEAAELLLSAVEVGATVVRLTDDHRGKTAREVLGALIDSCRQEMG